MVFLGHSKWENNLNLTQKTMGASILRQQTIANNISNANVPHYKRKSVLFESQLKRAIDQQQKVPPPFLMTQVRHISLEDPIDINQVNARTYTEFDTHQRNDKNNVDIEKEVSDHIKNNLHYTAMIESVRYSFKKIQSVLV